MGDFELISRSYEDMKKGPYGIIVNNNQVEEFKEVVNHNHRGAVETYTSIHRMLVGNILRGGSIFEIAPAFCSYLDYFLYVMHTLYGFDATAKFMDGELVSPVQTTRFRNMVISVTQKHIQICGCPAGKGPEVMKNLQILVSQPAPTTSATDFFGQVNFVEGCSALDIDRRKTSLLYNAKPFDYSVGILTAIKSQPIEVIEMISNLSSSNTLDILPRLENKMLCTGRAWSGLVLVRKEVGNPPFYFDKTYAEYKRGFASNGESWIGLDNLHRVTSQKDFSMKITMTDFDGKKYHAVWNQFKVGPEEDGYRLTVGSFNEAESTLGDSMISKHNGMKFSTKDRDQDVGSGNCAASQTGGWWWNNCGRAHLTGQHTDRRRQDSHKPIYYYDGGARGITLDSWKEATLELIPRD